MSKPRYHYLKASTIAVSLALSLTACGKSPEQHFKKAQELVQKADYKAAVVELKTVLQKQPDNREARLLLGQVSFKNGAYPDAEKELSKARSLGASDDQVLPALAKVYVSMGEPQKALDLGLPKTKLSPQSLAAFHAMRAEAQLSLGKRAEAEQSIATAKQADPNQPELLLTQAKLSLVDKQKPQAVQLVNAALESDPKFTDALYLKAMLLESESKPDDAIQVYQQILANDPTQFRAHLAIANLQMQKGDMEAADKAIHAAEKLAGKNPMVMYARGSLELRRGEMDKASNAFLDVLAIAPNHLPSMLSYAMASYNLGHYEQSIDYAGKVLGAVPNNLLAAKVLASSLFKTGDTDGALKTLAPLLPKYPNDAKLLAMAGEIYLRAKDYNKAMDYLDRAASLDPKNADVKTQLAAGHLAMGEGDKALTDLEQASSLSSKPGQADMALVVLYLQRKEFDQALQAIASLEKKLPNNPVTQNLRAAALFGKNDPAGARKALEEAVKIQPGFFPAQLNLARLDIADKKPEAARKRFETVLSVDKNNVQAMLALADLAAAQNLKKDQMAWLEKAAKADPKSIQAQQALIRAYLSDKENAKALAQATLAANANPESPDALNLLGATQSATGDINSSIDTFTRIVQKIPQSPDAYLHLALAQIANKQLATARDTLKKAIRLKPDHVPSLDALLRLELTDKKPDAAIKVAHAIQAVLPDSPFGFDREADILASQKNLPQAAKLYEIALGKGGNNATAIKLQRVLRLAGDVNKADKQLASWISSHPKDVAVRTYSADLDLMQGRDREAISQYQEILKIAPNSVVALNNLAALYQKEKDSRAMATAEQALKLAPENPGVQDTLGWILVEQGQLPRALELLRKAAAAAPKAGSVRYHYGVALARSGNNKDARKEIEAAIAGQKFPELEEAKSLLKQL